MTYNVFGGILNLTQLRLLTVICVLRQLTAVEQQMRMKDGKISELQEVQVAAVCFSVLYKILTAKMRENKNVTISDRFICFILTVKQSAALAACVLRATTKNRSSTFLRKKSAPPEKIPATPLTPADLA